MMILKAEIQHLNAIVPLFEDYRIFYKQKSNPEAAKAFLKERLEKQDTVFFIAYVGEQAVGFYQLFHSLSSVFMQPLFILNDLFIDRKFRKRGVGAALLDKAKSLCEQPHYKGISLKTETTNPAQHLYELRAGRRVWICTIFGKT